MTAPAYLRVLRERWRLITLVFLLSVGLAVLVTGITPKSYEATAQVLVSSNAAIDPTNQYQAAVFIQAQVKTFAQTINSPRVIHRVKSDLNLALTDAQLRAKLSAQAPASTTLINIRATDGFPGQAAALANSTASAFVLAIEQYTTGTGSKKPAVHLVITGPAVAPAQPTTPNAPLNLLVGIVLGLLMGAALAITRDRFDNRIKSVEDLARVIDTSVMGVIVDDSKAERHPLAVRAGPRNARAENFRQLRANLQFANLDHHPRIIAVSSSVPTEGKTMIALNLASSLAEAGFTVCLVETDLRRPTIAKSLGLAAPIGLTNVLINQISLSEALQIAGDNFYVLTAGPTPPNPSEVLASTYVREVIRSLLDSVDYVVLDTAPLLPVADGSEVAALADGTLLVARHKFTTEPQIKRALSALEQVGAQLLGTVLNRVPTRDSGDYGYGYGRAYHRSDKPPSDVDGPPAPRARRSGSAGSKHGGVLVNPSS